MNEKPFTTFSSGAVQQQVVTDLICRSATTGIKWVADIILSTGQSKIELDEWDGAYCKLNELLYKVNPEIYTKHRVPTTNNSFYDLTDGTHYILPLKNRNFMRVEVYRASRENISSPVKTIRITFYGKNRYVTYESQCISQIIASVG